MKSYAFPPFRDFRTIWPRSFRYAPVPPVIERTLLRVS